MGLIFIILAFLILAALIYGIFFLMFKLGWIIGGSNRNKWPLILAGAATVLLFAVAILSTMAAIHKYITPIMPVVEKTIQKTDITTGIHPYTSPQYGFTLNLFGGTEMTDWINLDDENYLQFGFDTNIGAIVKKSKTNPTPNAIVPISGFLVYAQKGEPLANVNQYLQEQTDEWTSIQNPQVRITAEPDFSVPNTVFLEGEGTTDQGKIFHLYVTLAAQDTMRYAVIGFVTGNPAYIQLTKDEIRSFRLPGAAPAVLPSSAALPGSAALPAAPQEQTDPTQPAE